MQTEEDEEGMVEESFSVGGSEIDDENFSQVQTEDDLAIDSSGKQKLADIKKSLRQRWSYFCFNYYCKLILKGILRIDSKFCN